MSDEAAAGAATAAAAKGGSKKGRLSVERIYQKKTPLEHILLRPDTYIGSVQPITEKMWVLDDNGSIVNREITYVPGLYKIFDEILVNAADNKQRDKKMDTIKIDINPETNQIKIYNNGKGIPVAHHDKEKMYVPTMIFGHLLTSSNFNDEEEKVTGGRNGYGAKLCNVFSTKFTLETACKEYKKDFKQSWANNMSKAGEPKIKEFSGEDFTRVTFYPDLAKFNMETLDKDTMALLSRRAWDIAASARGVKVYLNGKRIPIKNFKDYVDAFIKGHEDETGNQIKAIHEISNERWEIAVAVSDGGFKQMSFVNSIATTKGGRHVDHVSKLMENALTEVLKKKNKSGVQVKPHQIRNHMWVFVNCLIVNPTFDSQTKENMTLQQNQFGSKCTISDKFKTGLTKSGIVESVLAWSKFKQDQQLKSKHTAKKTNKLKGIAKLEDANDAGTKNSLDCTLILTEGDSAKTLAVAGMSIVGRDKYGVYPLRGKVLNVREASHKQIMENKEINDLVKIIGLQYKKKYDSVDDLKTLRYGRLMIMTDQDQDGSHIKGLLINFFHHNWPGLLRLPFLEEFITPIVKASKGNDIHSFFSLPEFQEWKSSTENWHTYKIKYYKGLGTSTSKEAKEYFNDMLRHRIKFHHKSEQDDYAINLAFSKKEIEQRKEWLTSWMEECKRRKELGLSEIYLYEKNTRSVTYQDFINKELILFSNADNERSIPSLVDGFKPGQRKVMFTCLKRNDKREVKVAQLAGSVGEMSAYHHGEMSLMGTIINLAQDYVGSNNINLLQPIGQFGTRLAGGKDHASPRYIFTQMSPLARLIFNANDDHVLNFLKDDNKKIEPEFYVPILPMVLVNGAEGIGTGWSTKVPNYNPREIIQNLLQLLDGADARDLPSMVPWFKGFRGTIEEIDGQRFVINGEIAEVSDTKLEITELPIRTWTQNYKESVMEPYLNGSEKTPALINDYREYHTDKTVKFVVNMAADKLRQAEVSKGLHQFFKLQTTMSTSSMVLFDHLGVLRRFDNVNEILGEFYGVRLEYYAKRKAFLEGMLGAEAAKLSNQARFIIEKCDGSLVVENKKKKSMMAELQRRNYDPDPVKRWRKTQEEVSESDVESGAELDDNAAAKQEDYDYLLGMAMWNLTLEKKEELLRKKDEKHQELELLKRTSEKDLWRQDLKEFSDKLDEVEAKQAEEDAQAMAKQAGKAVKGRGGGADFKQKKAKQDVMPSPHGVRIVPKIAEELRTKAAKAAAAKDRKEGKGKAPAAKKADAAKDLDKDEFDMMVDDKDMNTSLSEKLGFEKQKPEKAKKAAAPKKRGSNGAGKKKGGGRNPWESGSGGSGSDSDDDLDSSFQGASGRTSGKNSDVEFDIKDYGAPARDRPGRQRKTVQYSFDKSSSDDGSDVDDMKDNDGVHDHQPLAKDKANKNGTTAADSAPKAKKGRYSSDDDDDYKGGYNSDSDGGSDFGAAASKKTAKSKKETTKPAAAKKQFSDDEDNDSKFDDLFGGSKNTANGNSKNGGDEEHKNGSADNSLKRSNAFDSDSADDLKPPEPSLPKKKKAAAAATAAAAAAAASVVAAPPKKKKSKYAESSESEDDFRMSDKSDDDDGDDFSPVKKKPAAKSKPKPAEKPKPAKKAAAAAPAAKKPAASALAKKKNKFSESDEDYSDNDVIAPSPPKEKAPPKKKPTKKLFTMDDVSDGGDSDFGTTAASKKAKPAPKKKATATEAKKPAAKKKAAAFGSGSSADEMDFSGIKDYAPAADRPGRQKKTINYNFGGDGDSDA